MTSGFDAQVREYCEKEQIMGTLRITLKDQILYERSMGYADLANRTPFTEKTMFSFYSMTKPLCAIGVMKLFDRGLVELDAHPSEYVPEAKGFHEALTIRHLLTHTSGLADFEQNGEFARTHRPGIREKIREHLKELTSCPQNFAPGTGTLYENVNFAILALICENLSGKTWADYAAEEVFRPLGMETAVIDDENTVIENRACGYELRDGRLIRVDRATDWMFGAGDAVGTVADAYCLNAAIKHRKLLSDRAWELVLTPSGINDFGFGCTVTKWHDKTRIMHNGGHTGFRTLHMQIPEDDLDIILLSNSGFGNARSDLSDLAFRWLYNREDGKADASVMDKGYI